MQNAAAVAACGSRVRASRGRSRARAGPPRRARARARRPASSASRSAGRGCAAAPRRRGASGGRRAASRPPPRPPGSRGGSRAAHVADRLGRTGRRPSAERQARPLVVARRATSEARIWPPSQLGPTPFPSSRRRSGSACRAPVRRSGSWSLETSIGPPHARSTLAAASPAAARRRPLLGARGGRSSSKKRASICRARRSARSRSPSARAPVRGRPEVVQEHAPVGDRLAARPTDPRRSRSGTGSRQDDVAAEGRQPAAHRQPARRASTFMRRRSPGHGAAARS